MQVTSLCVFCGSDTGRRPEYVNAAHELGQTLAENNIRLVYGAGRVGLMGVIADACLAAGGEVVGIIPQHIVDLEVAHGALTEIVIVDTMHERKRRMSEMADAFVAMPGGFGTLEEFCEVLTWSQLGLHPKPCALMNVAGYYDPLLHLFDHAVREGFVRQAHRDLVLEDTSAQGLLSRLASYVPSYVPKFP